MPDARTWWDVNSMPADTPAAAPSPSHHSIPPWVLDMLPMAGAAAGGMVGGAGGTLFGMGVGGVPGGIGGAALGAAGGEATRQLLERSMGMPAPETPGAAAGDIARTGVEYGAFSAAPISTGFMVRGLLKKSPELAKFVSRLLMKRALGGSVGEAADLAEEIAAAGKGAKNATEAAGKIEPPAAPGRPPIATATKPRVSAPKPVSAKPPAPKMELPKPAPKGSEVVEKVSAPAVKYRGKVLSTPGAKTHGDLMDLLPDEISPWKPRGASGPQLARRAETQAIVKAGGKAGSGAMPEMDATDKLRQSIEFESELKRRGFTPAMRSALRRRAFELIQGGPKQ